MWFIFIVFWLIIAMLFSLAIFFRPIDNDFDSFVDYYDNDKED